MGFGPFQLFPEQRLLTRDGVAVPLGGRALDVLLYLAAREGQVVGKQALIAAIWPGRVVEENNLTVQVSVLRRLLGKNGDGRSVIQTISGRGYMFMAEAIPGPVPTSAAPGALAGASAVGVARSTMGFVGRVAERAEVAALLSSHRLVTITAAGGMGKTRLAREVALELAGAYPDGVHIAELASVDNPAWAVEQVATLFPLGSSEAGAVDRLTAYMRGRRLLLVLDNCEHLLDPVSELAGAILERCPEVSILATSREALGVAGERVFRLPALPVPGAGVTVDAAGALAFDAVRLFVERAHASVPGFVFDDAAVAGVVDVCRHVDGIALAIEMAVPRLRVLGPAQLAARLHESLRLLAAPDRTAPPRHRTLRAMIDWSYALLSEGQRVLLQRMVVFAGAVDFEAVEAVGLEGSLDPLEDLTGLVEKSLVVAEMPAEIPDGAARYRLLATVRQYARELLAPGEEGVLRGRHAAHYAGVFEAAAAAWPTTRTLDWLPWVAADADELRAALGWCFGPGGDAALGLRLAGASVPVWWELPNLPLREGRGWFDWAVALIGADTPAAVAARVWFGHSWRDMRQADTANLPSAERAVALFRETEDRVGLGAALWRAGSAALKPETAELAGRLLDEAEAVLREGRPGKWLALCLVRQGDRRMRARDTTAALAAYEESMELSRWTGYWYGLTNGGSNLADLLFQLGRKEEARTKLQELRDMLPVGPRTPLTCKLAAHLAIAGRFGEATEAVAEVVERAPTIGFGGAFARGMEVLALLRVEAGDAASAARLAGYAREALPPGIRWSAPLVVLERLEAALGRAVAPERLAQLLAEGAAWDEGTVDVMARAAVREQLELSI